MKSARDRMTIIATYENVGTYRGTATICGTTHKTVKPGEVHIRGRSSPRISDSAEKEDDVTKRIEKAAKAELGRLPVELRTCTLAEVVLDLARRLDAEPEDRAASMLSRELRLVLAVLHDRAGDAGGDDLDRFLASIANPALQRPGD